MGIWKCEQKKYKKNLPTKDMYEEKDWDKKKKNKYVLKRN